MAAGTPGLGVKSYIQIHPETTYGTRSTTNPSRLELLGVDIRVITGVIEDPSLNTSPGRRTLLAGATYYRGTFRVRANLEGGLEFLRAVFGGYANAVVEGSVRDHTFTEATNLKSYSIEVSEGDIPTGQVAAYLGARFARCTLRLEAAQGEGGMCTLEFEVVAKSKSLAATATSGTAPVSRPIPFTFSQSTTTDGFTSAADLVIKSWETTLTNPLTGDERIGFGSTNIGEVVRNNFVDVVTEITEEFQSTAMMAAAGTVASLQLKLMDAVTTIGTTSRYTYTLTMPKSLILGISAPVDDYGVMEQTINYRSYFDTGQSAVIKLVVRNLDVALV